MFVSRDIAIDLGTANTLLYIKGRGLVLSEPSAIAVNELTGEIVAAGASAWKMLGKAPEFIRSVRPLTHGVIADYEMTELMLRYYLACIGVHQFGRLLRRSRVVVAVPANLSPVELASIKDVVQSTTASDPLLLLSSMAAALGAGLPVLRPTGSMVVDIGSGTTEIAVMAGGGLVRVVSLREAGDEFNRAIMEALIQEFNLSVGELGAEELKKKLGAAIPSQAKFKSQIVYGKDISSGIPRQVTVSSGLVCKALEKPLEVIVQAAGQILEEISADLTADILKSGIVLTGGSALLPGLDEYLSRELGVRAIKTEEPFTTVVRGAGLALEELPKYQRLCLRNGV